MLIKVFVIRIKELHVKYLVWYLAGNKCLKSIITIITIIIIFTVIITFQQLVEWRGMVQWDLICRMICSQ